MIDEINWGGSGIEKPLYDYLINRFNKKTKMLELGSGEVSTRVFSEYFDLISIEQDKTWINKYSANYIYAPIKNNWYDVDYLSDISKDYSIVFVDGPSGTGNRSGLLNHLDMFNTDCLWVFHDTYRVAEIQLVEEFAKRTRKSVVFFDDGDYWAVVE